jgi:hypothetical protein
MPEQAQEKIIVTLPAPRKTGLHRMFSVLAKPARLSTEGHGSWNKTFKIPKRLAAEILLRDLPATASARIFLDGQGRGALRLEAPGLFTSGDSSGELGRPFNAAEGTVGAGRIMVDPDRQQQKLGRLVLRNHVEFFRAAGFRHLQIHAGFSAGGYAWARQGFLPENIHGRDFDTLTRKPVQQRYAVARAWLGAGDRAVLDAAVKFTDRHDIWRVADCGTDISTPLRAALAPGAAGSSETERLLSCFGGAWDYEVLGRFRSQLAAGGRMTLGQLLLAGTDWHGALDFDDVEQMRRAGAYAGGWKYLGYAPAHGAAPVPAAPRP